MMKFNLFKKYKKISKQKEVSVQTDSPTEQSIQTEITNEDRTTYNLMNIFHEKGIVKEILDVKHMLEPSSTKYSVIVKLAGSEYTYTSCVGDTIEDLYVFLYSKFDTYNRSYGLDFKERMLYTLKQIIIQHKKANSIAPFTGRYDGTRMYFYKLDYSHLDKREEFLDFMQK